MNANLKDLNVQEFNLKDQIGIDYWHTNILDKNQKSISAGFGQQIEKSRSIAYSEFLERSAFIKIKNSDENTKNKWGLNIIPTGCGFAAGYNLKNVILRSIGEAAERWTMSKWIDDSNHIEKITLEENLDQASKWFYSQFDKVDLYKKTIVVQYADKFLKYDIGFSLGFKNDGVFPGSAFDYSNSGLWQHALLESYRHYLIFKNNTVKYGFPDNKVHFFASNAGIAIDQISKAKNTIWPSPTINMHNSEYCQNENFYLARTIFSGWKSWNLGPVERFLY